MANDMHYTVNVDQTRMLPRSLQKTPKDLVVMGYGALCASERIQPLLLAHLPSQLVPLPLKKKHLESALFAWQKCEQLVQPVTSSLPHTWRSRTQFAWQVACNEEHPNRQHAWHPTYSVCASTHKNECSCVAMEKL